MSRHAVGTSLVVLAVLATVAFNGLANALPLNGLTTGGISDRYHVLFVPAGWAFSIWGPIYLGMALFALYQVLPKNRGNDRLRRIRTPFLVSCAANISWLYLWHHERFVATIGAMAVLLLSLVTIYLRLRADGPPPTRGETWFVRVPFSLYLGWITVATVANASTVLVHLGWNGWGIGDAVWTLMLLAVAVGLAAVVTLVRKDAVYDLVLVWAFTGIAVKHAGEPLVSPGAWVAAALAGGMAVTALLRGRRTAPGPLRV